MLRKTIKALLGPAGIRLIRNFRSRVAWRRQQATIAEVLKYNRENGVPYVNIGGGQDHPERGWWNGDVQTGFVFDAATVMPMKDGTIEFAYSSMFFEYIDDETALNLLKEVHRILKPGSVFRMVVPDFWLYIRKYRERDISFFNPQSPNLITWARLGVPVDLEHMFVSYISSIHNKAHILTPYPHLVDHKANPPIFTHPHQEAFEGYYCGPAPEISTQMIRDNFATKSECEFLEWVFQVTNASKHQDPTFNSWHKNWWNEEKLRKFSLLVGFSEMRSSAYGQAPISLSDAIEKPGHAAYGLYFELTK
jgi:SAM-dependent methyltransferase